MWLVLWFVVWLGWSVRFRDAFGLLILGSMVGGGEEG